MLSTEKDEKLISFQCFFGSTIHRKSTNAQPFIEYHRHFLPTLLLKFQVFVKDDRSQNVWKLSIDAKSPLKGNWIYKYVIRMLCYLWIVQVWGRVDKENIRICILFIFPHRVLLIFRKEWHILNQDMKEQCREIFICWNHIFLSQQMFYMSPNIFLSHKCFTCQHLHLRAQGQDSQEPVNCPSIMTWLPWKSWIWSLKTM